MNSKFIAATVVAIAALGSASAFAQNNQYGEAALAIAPVAATSNVTRSQVQADYLQTRQTGALAISNEGAFAVAPAAATSVTRAEVRADAAKARQEDGRNAS